MARIRKRTQRPETARLHRPDEHVQIAVDRAAKVLANELRRGPGLQAGQVVATVFAAITGSPIQSGGFAVPNALGFHALDTVTTAG